MREGSTCPSPMRRRTETAAWAMSCTIGQTGTRSASRSWSSPYAVRRRRASSGAGGPVARSEPSQPRSSPGSEPVRRVARNVSNALGHSSWGSTTSGEKPTPRTPSSMPPLAREPSPVAGVYAVRAEAVTGRLQQRPGGDRIGPAFRATVEGPRGSGDEAARRLAAAGRSVGNERLPVEAAHQGLAREWVSEGVTVADVEDDGPISGAGAGGSAHGGVRLEDGDEFGGDVGQPVDLAREKRRDSLGRVAHDDGPGAPRG